MLWTREKLSSATEYQQTQIDYLRARTLFALQDAAAAVNVARIASYLSAYADYKSSRDNRPDLPPPTTPEPAFAMIVAQDQYGNPVEGTSTDRVCPPMLYVVAAKPELKEGLVGKRLYPGNDVYFDILRGDTTPNMKQVDGPSADGVTGKFQKYAYLQSSPGAHEIPGVFIKVA